eukprot:scaffold90201_cov45-Phaeocystis_antarctica.AAC.1
MLAFLLSPTIASATKPSQLRNARASFRLAMNCRLRRIRSIAARRSAAITTNEAQPADCLRLSRCSRDFDMLSRFRAASSHCACQPTQPRDSSRCSRCSSALDMLAFFRSPSPAASIADSQLRNAGASLRFPRNDAPRRISSNAARRSVAIAINEAQPADTLRFS